jgi:hypothetical protein
MEHFMAALILEADCSVSTLPQAPWKTLDRQVRLLIISTIWLPHPTTGCMAAFIGLGEESFPSIRGQRHPSTWEFLSRALSPLSVT